MFLPGGASWSDSTDCFPCKASAPSPSRVGLYPDERFVPSGLRRHPGAHWRSHEPPATLSVDSGLGEASPPGLRSAEAAARSRASRAGRGRDAWGMAIRVSSSTFLGHSEQLAELETEHLLPRTPQPCATGSMTGAQAVHEQVRQWIAQAFCLGVLFGLLGGAGAAATTTTSRSPSYGVLECG